ncbi:MAG: Omp28-related outer membrane protein [Bacteroidia bacterium]|nr:Omp28-related outer membrane protein [Bacteroidia bacterium]
MRITLLFCLALLQGSFLLNAQSVTKVLLEEHTGAWCGFCPDGALILNDILDNHPNVIGVSIHNGDGMVTPDGNYIANFYTNSFPSGTINRQDAAIGRNLWESECVSALTNTAPVSVSFENVALNESTHELTLTLRATWSAGHSGKHRINLFIVEDSVTGTGSLYDQVNYYNTTAGSPLQGLGNPIHGYVHRHVLRLAVDGAWGNHLTIPNAVVAGDEQTRDYTVTLNSDWDVSRIHLVGMVSLFNGGLQNQRPILNSEEVKLSEVAVGMEEEISAVNGVTVYPNPFNEHTTVQFNLEKAGKVKMEVLNPIGQQVALISDGMMGSGMHTLSWNGQNNAGAPAQGGVYFIRISTDNGQAVTKMVVLAR